MPGLATKTAGPSARLVLAADAATAAWSASRCWSPRAPPATVTAAQFVWSSRFPWLLSQDLREILARDRSIRRWWGEEEEGGGELSSKQGVASRGAGRMAKPRVWQLWGSGLTLPPMKKQTVCCPDCERFPTSCSGYTSYALGDRRSFPPVLSRRQTSTGVQGAAGRSNAPFALGVSVADWLSNPAPSKTSGVCWAGIRLSLHCNGDIIFPNVIAPFLSWGRYGCGCDCSSNRVRAKVISFLSFPLPHFFVSFK